MSDRSFFRAKRPPLAGALLGVALLAAPTALAHAGDVDVWREDAAHLHGSNSSAVPPHFEPKAYFLRATFFIALVFFFCMVLLIYRIVRMIQYKFVPLFLSFFKTVAHRTPFLPSPTSTSLCSRIKTDTTRGR